MNKKTKVKLILDFVMTIVLFLLMAYQVVGELLHEWLGVFGRKFHEEKPFALK